MLVFNHTLKLAITHNSRHHPLRSLVDQLHFNRVNGMKKKILMILMISSMAGCATPVKQNSEPVELKVNDELWSAVTDFSNSSPDDKHYIVRTEEDGTTVIVFGDGKHGRKPPSETNEIRVRYSRASNRHYVGLRMQQGRINTDDCK